MIATLRVYYENGDYCTFAAYVEVKDLVEAALTVRTWINGYRAGTGRTVIFESIYQGGPRDEMRLTESAKIREHLAEYEPKETS